MAVLATLQLQKVTMRFKQKDIQLCLLYERIIHVVSSM